MAFWISDLRFWIDKCGEIITDGEWKMDDIANDSGFAVLNYGQVDSVFVEIFLPSLPAPTLTSGLFLQSPLKAD
jgi:hypothetical protein